MAIFVYAFGIITRILIDQPDLRIPDPTFAQSYISSINSSDNNEVFWHILTNNLRLNLLIVLSSSLLCLPVILILFSNGFILVDYILVSSDILGIEKLIFSILPHGILELVTFFWASHISYKLSTYLLSYLIKGTDDLSILKIRRLGVSVLWVVVLTSIAAFIETFVTVNLIS